MSIKNHIIIKIITKVKSLKIFKNLVDRLYNSSMYWKYRHIINSSFWYNQYNHSTEKSRNIYSDISKKYSLNTFFEFGCGSAPNLKNIITNHSKDIKYLGYDISNKAIDVCREKYSDKSYKFINKISKSIIKDTLASYKSESFDCAIYHRVFYLLNKKLITKHLYEYSNLFKYIIIYDFHKKKSLQDSYLYRNYNILDYESLLLEFDFSIIFKQKTDPYSESQYFRNNAHFLLFKNNKKNNI
ncbi:class I SAM-dependent methyltransferase [Prochlorococcus marinus]|uniref:Methyltransferase type 12 domain-containing protein n=1 Tax=Prochlorococcus marinus XMU1408 TaxID=2213228 RepID=A0A318R451_PROMR|nr:class I SAM-dependent methyltransferase [Prochlorococcus marinus]MBW3041825.1 hypothetical protein [Prochlorococcus marinus str. XMU1408]PYE02964.1 hypothetical protein DNJ73_04240 [Prochlorococcus marinus XMU1408]